METRDLAEGYFSNSEGMMLLLGGKNVCTFEEGVTSDRNGENILRNSGKIA